MRTHLSLFIFFSVFTCLTLSFCTPKKSIKTQLESLRKQYPLHLSSPPRTKEINNLKMQQDLIKSFYKIEKKKKNKKYLKEEFYKIISLVSSQEAFISQNLKTATEGYEEKFSELHQKLLKMESDYHKREKADKNNYILNPYAFKKGQCLFKSYKKEFDAPEKVHDRIRLYEILEVGSKELLIEENFTLSDYNLENPQMTLRDFNKKEQSSERKFYLEKSNLVSCELMKEMRARSKEILEYALFYNGFKNQKSLITEILKTKLEN